VSDIGKKAVRGALWSTAANLVSRMITVVSTVILTRYLTPAVQGDVNIAFVIISTSALLTSLGMAQYIVAHPRSERSVTFHASVIFLVAGFVGFGITWAVASPIGKLVGAPGCIDYIPGFVLAQCIERVLGLPRAVLSRELRFREVGIRLTLGELVFSVTTVLAAKRGYGGQSIVIGNVARAIVGAVYYAIVVDVRDYLEPARLSLATLKRLLKYGAPMSIGALFHYGATTWDNLFMAWRFGEATTGLYNQAYKLADLPATQLGEQFGDVLVPSFARVEDPERRKSAVLRAASILALVVFPLAIGLGAIAPTLVTAFLPESYAGVGTFLVVLAALSVFRPIGFLVMGYLQVVGRTLSYMWLDFLKVVTILGSMWALSSFGPVWACAGVGIGFGLNAIQMVRAMRPDGYSAMTLFRAMLPPLFACAPMVGAVIAVRHLLDAPPITQLSVELLVGAVAYIASALVIARAASRELLALLRRGLSRTV